MTDRTLVIEPSRTAQVGEVTVRRALPRRRPRTVGAWCFADHVGPVTVGPDTDTDIGIGPHPHVGLQTVTWLLGGELLHRDTLGSEQVIRPGQLNLMTAGRGVAHAEEGTGSFRGSHHGLQLWVAQPEATRDGPAAFEHHVELPQLELDGATLTVLVGELAGVGSPARRDTDHVGVDLVLRTGTTVLPLVLTHEHGVVVMEGEVAIDGQPIGPGNLGYLPVGRDELAVEVTEPARAVLLGGTPFGSEILMWWNFVARSREEIAEARASWQADDDRFGLTGSPLERISAPGLPSHLVRSAPPIG